MLSDMDPPTKTNASHNLGNILESLYLSLNDTLNKKQTQAKTWLQLKHIPHKQCNLHPIIHFSFIIIFIS